MNAPLPGAGGTRRYARLVVPLAAAALVAWLLWSRSERAPPGPSGPGPVSAVPAPATPVGAVRVPEGSAPGSAAAADSASGQGAAADAATLPSPPAAGSADERQFVKVTRGLSVGEDGRLRVSATPPGSVVGQLHLQPGDVLLRLNGQPVATLEDFARIYREQGLPSELTLLRDGKEIHRR